MALTVALTESTVQGNKRVNRGTMAFDNSYPTGGEAFTNRQLGLSSLDQLIVYDNEDALMFAVDYANSKVKAIWPTSGATPAAGVEVTDQTNLSGLTGVRWEATGS